MQKSIFYFIEYNGNHHTIHPTPSASLPDINIRRRILPINQRGPNFPQL
jgi:hypothetical protein